MYKIFINDKLLYITDQLPHEAYSSDVIICKSNDEKYIKSNIIEFKKNPGAKKMYILKDNFPVDNGKEEIFYPFTFLRAAGGLVRNLSNEYLFIFRYRRWDLPKGLLEKGEKGEDTAIREVEEETGVNHLKIENLIDTTYHFFEKNDVFYIKETQWFHMFTDFNGALKPQFNEYIYKVKWFNREEIKNTVYPSAYKSIIEVLNCAGL